MPWQHSTPGPCSDPSEGTESRPQVTAGSTDHDRREGGLFPLPVSGTEDSLGSGTRLLSAKMRAVYELSDDAGTGRDAHLDHDEPQESLHSVRADVHSLRDFFTSEPVCQMQHRFDFAF